MSCMFCVLPSEYMVYSKDSHAYEISDFILDCFDESATFRLILKPHISQHGVFPSLSCVFLSLPSHSLFFCPSFIYNRTWQGIISCIMKSSRPVIYTVTVYYSLLSLKTLNVNEATLCSAEVWVVAVSGSETLLGHNADSYCCCPPRYVMKKQLDICSK